MCSGKALILSDSSSASRSNSTVTFVPSFFLCVRSSRMGGHRG